MGQGWRIAFNYNGLLDEAFVHVFLVASSVAIMLWSTSIMRDGALARGAGIYGYICGTATVLALVSGQMDRHAHVFIVAILGQALWFVIVGISLWRERTA